ncbi:PRD domain-containing protein [Enterococcus hulanensis]|uniref:BglG family transcription antiterminator LicT n=1 Tax=Enterococcus hulanensis TaxID=2559929 RepID=UPI001A90A7DC|nr:PRD domain-containing protein [Enterococcus hulanensis]MBO0457643.1 PRD domain-containing protein [Enterococcus hulanensis]
MKIVKPLNNNVVLAVNNSNEEVVLMGKGVAYQKKIGDTIDVEDAEKVFTLTNELVTQQLQELLTSLPPEYVMLADRVISHTKKVLNKELSESLYISLADHIFSSVQRFIGGVVTKNVMLWDIQRFYASEYQIGLLTLEWINESFKVQLPEDEAGLIALHIVDAELDTKESIANEVTQLIQEISNFVRYHFKMDFSLDSVSYFRFVTHLKFFAKRFFSMDKQPAETDPDLFSLVTAKYPDAFECVKKIEEFLLRKYHFTITEDDQLYLTIHIEKLIKEARG